MTLENREIILFQNIRQVIKAELWCLKNQVQVKVIPVPKPYSTECGLCLETGREGADRLEQFSRDNGMIIERVIPNIHELK